MRPPRLRDSLPEYFPTAGDPTLESWPTLLVVDDDRSMLTTLVCYFEKRGFHVAAGSSLVEAKTFFHRRKTWTLVISDYHLCDGTGWELFCWIREQVPVVPPFLLMSGSIHGPALSGEVQFIAKPFTLTDLEARLRGLLSRKSG